MVLFQERIEARYLDSYKNGHYLQVFSDCLKHAIFNVRLRCARRLGKL